MIAKYPGKCCYCGKAITPGTDVYDVETKKNWHEDCRENQPPGPEAFGLARELGFVPHEDAVIRAAIPAWRVRQDWLLRNLFKEFIGDSAWGLKANSH